MSGLQAEGFTQVHLTHHRVGKHFCCRSGGNDRAVVDDVGARANAERFAHIMVGDQHADAARRQFANDLLDIGNRQGVENGQLPTARSIGFTMSVRP